MMSMNLINITILNIKGSDYCCIFNLISKNEAINSIQNTGLAEKSGTLSNKISRAIAKLQIYFEF